MDNSVEEIKSRLNIVDVVGEYVRLTKSGAHWKANCPFHNEKTPSFMVNEDKQIYHCFGCNKGGDLFSFVMDIESLDFREALKILAEKAGVELKSFNPKVQERKSKVLDALEASAQYYEKQLWESEAGKRILQYLHDRGISDESIRKFRLGYSPDGWSNTSRHLMDKGFSLKDMVQAGLVIEKQGSSQAANYSLPTTNCYDRFRDRIMFPIQDSMGKVIGYSARVAPGGDESQAKYINTPETEVYHKGRALYGIFQAKQEIKSKNSILLVEGNLDVIAAHQAGLGNTVAVSGTALTDQQLDILKRYSENIKMFFDMDSAGQSAAKKSAQLCYEKGFAPSIVSIEEGKDAADIAAKDPQKLLEVVSGSVPAVEYFIRSFSKNNDNKTAEGKRVIAKEVGEIISHISNKIEKMHWIAKLSQELEVEEKALSDVLNVAQPKGSPTSTVADTRVERGFVKRSEIIRDKIAGILLADPKSWEEVSSDEGKIEEYSQYDLLRFILREGEKVRYSYENMALRVNEDIRTRLQGLYFDARFKFGEKEVKEFSHEDMSEMLAGYFEEHRKELLKEKLDSIIRDIKKAELSGDKETLVFLMNEFSKISSQLK